MRFPSQAAYSQLYPDFNPCLLFLGPIEIFQHSKYQRTFRAEKEKNNIASAFIYCYIAIMCWNCPVTFKRWSTCQEGFFARLVGSNWNAPILLYPPATCKWSGPSMLPNDAFYLSATTYPRGCSALLPPPGRTTAKLHCWWVLPLEWNKERKKPETEGQQTVPLPFGAQYAERLIFKRNALSIFVGMCKGLQCTPVTEDWLFPERPKDKQ